MKTQQEEHKSLVSEENPNQPQHLCDYQPQEEIEGNYKQDEANEKNNYEFENVEKDQA